MESKELNQKANDYSFGEFTRPMEILQGISVEKQSQIRQHILLVSRDSYIAGYNAAESSLISE